MVTKQRKPIRKKSAVAKKRVAGKKVSTRKKSAAAKKKVAGKKVSTRKKSAGTKKRVAGKKVSTRKKSAAAKKKVAGKKVSTRKKSAGTKKRVAGKKVSTRKKSAAAKKKVAGKKVSTRKKSAGTKKRVARKKVSARTKSAVATPRKKIQKTKSDRKTARAKASAKKSSARMIVSKKKTQKVYTNRNYMTVEQLDLFREKLIAWKKELMQEADRTVVHMQEESSTFADSNDRATQEEEFGRELKSRDRERKLIKKINEALARIENHEFGYCEECAAPIGITRLTARPITTMCIDCKTLAEVIEKQASHI